MDQQDICQCATASGINEATGQFNKPCVFPTCQTPQDVSTLDTANAPWSDIPQGTTGE